jgi:hypothetical protein
MPMSRSRQARMASMLSSWRRGPRRRRRPQRRLTTARAGQRGGWTGTAKVAGRSGRPGSEPPGTAKVAGRSGRPRWWMGSSTTTGGGGWDHSPPCERGRRRSSVAPGCQLLRAGRRCPGWSANRLGGLVSPPARPGKPVGDICRCSA